MIKYGFCIIIASISISILAQGPAITGGPIGISTQQNTRWQGSYHGEISGTNSVLSLSLSGTQLEGQIDASGYIYNLSGEINDNTCAGKLLDKNTGGSMEFKASLNGNLLNLILLVPNEEGQVNEWPIQYSRVEGGQALAGSAQSQYQSQSQNQSQSQQDMGSGQRDPALVGGWRHTESYTSGEFGTTSEWYMTINQDGSYIYGDGQIAGGGDGYSFSSGEGSDNETGKWKTENSIIYIYDNGWQAYARYYIEGTSMLFTFQDGSKQLWERYR